MKTLPKEILLDIDPETKEILEIVDGEIKRRLPPMSAKQYLDLLRKEVEELENTEKQLGIKK